LVNIIGKTFLQKIHHFCEFVANISLIILVVLVFAQVVLRNLFLIGSPQLDEGSRLAHLVLLFMMIPVLFAEEAHIKVEIIERFLPVKIDRLISLISHFFSFGFVIFFMFSSLALLGNIWDVPTAALRIPSALLYAGPVLGVVFSGLFIAEKIIDALVRYRKGG